MGEASHLAPADSKRASQYHRRNSRIAIRQLKRIELYVVALSSIELDDVGAAERVDDLIRRVRAYRQYLTHLKLTV